MDDNYEHIKTPIIYVNSHYLLTNTFFMKRLFTIMLFAAMLLPWAVQSQAIMPNYTSRTGVDASKWITLDATATQLLGSDEDDEASSVTNIGFNFLFGEDYYSQFSVGSNGFLTLGPVAAGTSTTAGKFSSSASFPKITGLGRDIGTCDNGYIKYKLVGTAPSRILVVEFKVGIEYSASNADALWQVQLHEDSNKVVLVYGATAPTTSPSAYQSGLGVSINDFLIINPTSHAITHHTASYSTNSSGWHGVNRYYEFVAPIITCAKPAGLAISNITTSTADLEWTEMGTATQWIVEYDTAGFTRGTGTGVLVSTPSMAFQSLDANTEYDVYVRAYCGVDDTSNFTKISFRTKCNPIDDIELPLVEDFETWATASINPCWLKGNSSTATYPTINTTSPHSGTKNVYMYSTTSYATWLVLPEFTTAISGLQLSFWMKSASVSYPLIVAVVPDVTDMTTFDTVAIVTCSSTSVWHEFVIPMSIYQGNGGRIALISPNGVTSYPYIDDVKVELLPSCPDPMNLTAMATGTESAVVRWLNTGASGFEVQYGEPGFALGTGTSEYCVGDSLEIYGLTANTAYDIYLRANCGGDDTGRWFGPVSIRTACEALTDNELPYYEGFTSWISTTNRNSCYTLKNTSTESYPSLSTLYSRDSLNAVYMYSTASYASWMALPAFDTYLNNLQVSFSLYKTSTADYPLIVGVMTNPNDLSTFDTISIVNCSYANQWQDFIVPLSLYEGEGQYIAFVSPNGVASCNYIDSIVVDYVSSCPNPVNVSAHALDHQSMVVYHTSTASSGSIIIEYGMPGFVLGTGDQVFGDIDSTIVSFLSPVTNYEVYVYTSCGADQSIVAGPFYVRTGCSPDPIDLSVNAYREDFNSYNNGGATSSSAPSTYPNHILPSCWSFLNMSATSGTYPQAFISGYSAYAVDGNCLFFKSSDANPIVAVLPQFSNNIEDIRIRFSYRNEGTTSSNGNLVLGVMTDPTVDSTFIAVETYPLITTITDIEHLFPQDTLLGSDYYIAFRYLGGSSNYYMSIDNVVVDLAPTCIRPVSIACTGTTNDAATIQWVDEELEHNTWEIAYGPTGFNPDSIETTLIGELATVYGNAGGDSATIQFLTSGTIYDFYIRTNCSGTVSEWRGPIAVCPGSHNIPQTGISSVTGCNVVLCDDGGIDAQYSNNNAGYTIVYPGSQDSVVALVAGNYKTENNNDKIKVFDGVGISGILLGEYTGTGSISDTIVSYSGPLTVQFVTNASTINDGFALQLSCVEAPTCPSIIDLAVSNVAPASAYVSWDYAHGALNVPSSYQIEVEDTLGSINYYTTTDPYYFVSGLESMSSYIVRVKAVCDDASEGNSESINIITGCFASIESDTINNGTASTGYYVPASNFYKNSYTQQLILASEMNGANVLTGIMFEYNYATAMSSKTNVSIYIGHTSTTTLTSSAWEPTTNAQLVYTGSLNCSQGWNEFMFDVPFAYNGTSNLVITVVDQSNAYNGSAYTYRTHSASGKALYYQTDSEMSVPPSSRTSYGYRANMKFIACDNTVSITCPAPNVIITEVTPDQVDIIWAVGGDESSWDVEYREVGDSVWTVAATATTATSYSFTNLTPSTNYEFKVVALCGTENGEQIVTATTPCALVTTYPFRENFDTWATGSTANYGNRCWGRLTNYTSTRYPYVSSSYSQSASNSVYFYGSSSYHSALILPKFDLPVDTLVINFGLYITSAAYQLQVGVITDPTDIATFVPVGIAHPTTTGQWQNFEFVLSSLDGVDGQIAIVAPQGATAYGYIDNVEVYPIPSCPRPTNVTVDANTITTSSAVISWTDTTAYSWTIEYGPRGFAQGTGTTVSANTNSYTLQGLDHSTYYDVYVTAQCSATDFSYASFPVSFATMCGTMEFPMFEDFTGYQTGSGTAIPHFPLCWNGGGYSTTYPYISSGTGIDGVTTIYEYLYAYAAAADRGSIYTYLALPAIDSTMYQASDLMVSFVTKAGTASSTYDARLYVGVATDPNNPATFVAVDTIERTTTDWVTISELELSSYTGNGKYIVFWVCPQTASYSTFYIDDIEVDVIPTCYRPQDLHITDATATSVELAWTERNNATSWTIEYVAAGQVQGTGTTVVANSNPFTITGLTANTHYDFYVKSNCSATDESRYTRKVSGWTTQVPANVPYAYDFENGAEWNNWAVTSNTTANWVRGTATAAQGSNAMYVSTDEGATCSTIDGIVNATAYRDFNFGANDTNFTLTFKAKAGGRTDGNYDGLMLYLVDPWLNAESSATGLNTPWGHVNNLPRINGLFVRLDTVYDEYAVELDAVSGIKRLAFYYFNQTHAGTFVGGPAAVDDINMVYTTCPRPTNVAATNLTTNSATISWNGSASGYYVYYRRDDQQSIDSVYTTSNTITLTNLTSSGTYLLAVKSICGSEMSIFSQTIQFYTPQVLAQVPYYCGFEATESETSQWAIVNGDAANGWCIGTATADSGSASLYVTNDFTNKPNTYTITSSSVSWAFRDFYFPPIAATDTFEINFRWRCGGEGSYDHMKVYIGPAAGTPTAGATSTVTVPTGATLLADQLQDRYDDEGARSGYVTKRIILSGAEYGADNYRIYFCWRNDGSIGEQPPISIDNFRIIAPEAMCPTPVLSANVVSNTATISWPEAGNYELKYRRAADADFGQEIALTNATSYTITGLDPLTDYVCQVRRICDADLGNSNWAEIGFTTEDLPCGVPTNIVATNITFTSATLSWTDPNGTQTSWTVEYGYGENTHTITANASTIELTDLYAGMTYNVRVQGNCSETVSSEWSEVYTFTTATCQTVSNLVANEITSSSAVITWTAPAGQTKWELSYGMQGVDEEHGTKVTVTVDPTFTIEGLEEDMSYDVYVRAVCGQNTYSAWSTKLQFTTRPVSINTAANDNVNVRIYPNPANTEATISVEGINGKVEFVVADMNGRMIVTETINCDGQLVKTIDVSNLAKGAYFVHIYNNNFNTTRKLIVK